MDPRSTRCRARSSGLPRTRGDGPRWWEPTRFGHQASPHTRGWTPEGRHGARPGRGFPAHAGMDRTRRGRAPRRSRLPRTRGDGPLPNRRAEFAAEASPHTRGWTLIAHRHGSLECGFPAHAGMDPGRRRRVLRGGPASPHTRGWTLHGLDKLVATVGFPAHAGMDPPGVTSERIRSRLPRTRGDGPDTVYEATAFRQASPHTRGWTRAGGQS